MPGDGELLCIIPGPSKELRREPAGDRWCFACRKRLPHDDVLLGDEGPSYYDPVWVRKCSGCGNDRTTFPGSDHG